VCPTLWSTCTTLRCIRATWSGCRDSSARSTTTVITSWATPAARCSATSAPSRDWPKNWLAPPSRPWTTYRTTDSVPSFISLLWCCPAPRSTTTACSAPWWAPCSPTCCRCVYSAPWWAPCSPTCC
ncbi:hypothetical protein CRUP_017397, partial [Coryphaenoides rupestris]